MLWPSLHARAENIRYLYDATGHGWVCLRCNEQMDVEPYGAGAYPDGTRVIVLEEKRDDLFAMSRFRVQIGRAVGWVFEDELLAEDMWLQKKESGFYVPFQNQWLVNDNGMPSVLLYANSSIFDPEPIIGTVDEPSFTALGIYNSMIHVQSREIDGYLFSYNCIPDITKPSITYGDREVGLWINAMERAIIKAKGTEEADWTEEERALLRPFDPVRTWTDARQIEPANCDIGSAEAEQIILQRLIEDGHVQEDVMAQIERLWYFLFYDYDDPSKHIWEFAFSDSPNRADDFFTNIIANVDAHTGEITMLDVDGP